MKLFIYSFLLLPVAAQCFERGDEIIGGGIARHGNHYITFLKIAKYEPESSGKEYRSNEKTDLRVVLKDQAGTEIESAYLVMREKGISFGSGSARFGKRRAEKAHSNPSADEAFSYFIFRYLPKASYVEVFKDGKAVSKEMVPARN